MAQKGCGSERSGVIGVTDASCSSVDTVWYMNLSLIFEAMYRRMFSIVAVTFFVTFSFLIYSYSIPNVYQASAVLVPTDRGGSSGMSGLVGQLGGLASIAGISMAEKNSIHVAIETMQSRAFIGDFIKRHDALADLIAVEGWDAEADKLKYNSDDFNEATGEWVRDVKFPRTTVPSVLEGYEVFSKILKVDYSAQKNIVSIGIEHVSAEVAQKWVNLLVQDINNYMRNADIRRADKSIEYLAREVSNTSISEMSTIYYKMLEEQTKVKMLALVSPDYTFKIIDPAVNSYNKVRPNRILIVFLGCFLGGLLALIYVLVYEIYYKKSITLFVRGT